MPGQLFNLPKAVPLNVGAIVSGGKLTFSQTGTATAQNTYTDAALTVASSNPVVADSNGVFAPIYLDPSLPDYRVLLTDSADVTTYQVDDVPAGVETALNFTVTDAAPYYDLIESDASAGNGKWRIQAQGEQLLIYAANDALSVFTPVVTVDRTGTTVDTVNFAPTSFQINAATIYQTGTFTPTLTGFSADPSSPTTSWALSGQTVTLRMGFTTGTSDATTFTITNLPAALTPVNAQIVPIIGLHDNTADSAAVGSILISGTTLTFGLGGDNPLGGGFTASGTKGFSNANVAINYSLWGT